MSNSAATSPVLDSEPVLDPEYVDDRVLPKRTPISRVTYQHMRASGEGPPYYRIGRRCVYKWSEVQAWIASHRVGRDGGAK